MLYDAIGLVGVALYVLAYFGTQVWSWPATSPRYLLCNGLGALLVIVSLLKAFNLASFVTQIIWLVLSAYGLLRYAHRARPNC